MNLNKGEQRTFILQEKIVPVNISSVIRGCSYPKLLNIATTYSRAELSHIILNSEDIIQEKHNLADSTIISCLPFFHTHTSRRAVVDTDFNSGRLLKINEVSTE